MVDESPASLVSLTKVYLWLSTDSSPSTESLSSGSGSTQGRLALEDMGQEELAAHAAQLETLLQQYASGSTEKSGHLQACKLLACSLSH